MVAAGGAVAAVTAAALLFERRMREAWTDLSLVISASCLDPPELENPRRVAILL